jgi:hypothetical protein
MKNETNPNPLIEEDAMTTFEQWFKKAGDKLRKSSPKNVKFMLVAISDDGLDGFEAAVAATACPHETVGLIKIATDKNAERLEQVGPECGEEIDPTRN